MFVKEGTKRPNYIALDIRTLNDHILVGLSWEPLHEA